MIHLALVVLAFLFLLRVGLGLFVGGAILLAEHPPFAKGLTWSLIAAVVAIVSFVWWAISPAGFVAALIWTAIISLVIFAWRRHERRRARKPPKEPMPL